MSDPGQVPAWQVQSGSYSHPDYVFVLTDDINDMGWPRTRLVHRLTPVDAAEQQRLQQVRPDWVEGRPSYASWCPTERTRWARVYRFIFREWPTRVVLERFRWIAANEEWIADSEAKRS